MHKVFVSQSERCATTCNWLSVVVRRSDSADLPQSAATCRGRSQFKRAGMAQYLIAQLNDGRYLETAVLFIEWYRTACMITAAPMDPTEHTESHTEWGGPSAPWASHALALWR